MAARKPPVKRFVRKFQDNARVAFLRRMDDSTAYHGFGTVVRYRPRKRDYVVHPDGCLPGEFVFFDAFELDAAPESVAPISAIARAKQRPRLRTLAKPIECPSEGSEGGGA